MTRLILPPPPLDRLTAGLTPALVALTLALALPAGPAHAQTIGQEACPDSVTQAGIFLRVTDVEADRATLRGGSVLNYINIQDLSEVTVDRLSGWYSATLYFGVRGYGYPEGAQDARKVPFTDGDLVHGAWLHVGRVEDRFILPTAITFLSLEPSTTYVAQLVVGELRNSQGKVVTNQFVRGTANPVNGNKPKPVLSSVCFETAASSS